MANNRVQQLVREYELERSVNKPTVKVRCYCLSVISAMNTVNVTGAFRSFFCHSYNSRVLLVKMSVVQAFYPRQNCSRPSISRLLRGAGDC